MKLLAVKVLVLVVVLSSLLMACGGTDTGSGAASEITYRQGYSGLVIEMIPGMPPAKIFEGQSFEVGLRVCNQGAFDVSEGKISLSGFDSTYIRTDISTHRFPQNALKLEGKNVFNPSGGCTNVLTYPAHVISVEDGVLEYPANYYLNTISKQSFELSQTVCVGGTSAYMVNDGGCSIDTPITLNGQGSSLGVSRINTIAQGSPSRIVFDVQLNNGGGGVVSKATITKAQLGGNTIDCMFKRTQSRTYEFSDTGDTPSIFCESPIEQEGPSYTTTLFVEVFYDYQQHESNQLLVEGRVNIDNLNTGSIPGFPLS
jgi:hypothetical protein